MPPCLEREREAPGGHGASSLGSKHSEACWRAAPHPDRLQHGQSRQYCTPGGQTGLRSTKIQPPTCSLQWCWLLSPALLAQLPPSSSLLISPKGSSSWRPCFKRRSPRTHQALKCQLPSPPPCAVLSAGLSELEGMSPCRLPRASPNLSGFPFSIHGRCFCARCSRGSTGNNAAERAGACCKSQFCTRMPTSRALCRLAPLLRGRGDRPLPLPGPRGLGRDLQHQQRRSPPFQQKRDFF